MLEEDKIKLYYTIRVLQDFVAQSRIKENEMESWPDEVQFLVRVNKYELQVMYRNARYDIVQQFIESESAHCFGEFVQCVKQYAREKNPQTILEFFESNPNISERTVDKWRLLLERIVNGWYDLYTFNEEELGAIEEIESILGERILAGKRIYEGLSFP